MTCHRHASVPFVAALCLAALGRVAVGSSSEAEIEALLVRQNAELRARLEALEKQVGTLDGESDDGSKEAYKGIGFARKLNALADLPACLDSLWILICGALVMFMQAGFSFLEAGSVRAAKAQLVLLKNLLDVTIGTVMWWLLGYGIAYGLPSGFTHAISGTPPADGSFAGSYGFAGYDFITLDADGTYTGTNHPKDWFFQWAFCATAATIVSGAVAERITMLSYIIYSTLMTVLIYPFIVYWTWSGSGWLTVDWGYTDFAGSGIVHLTGGMGALVGAIILGPRTGRFENTEAFKPGNIGFVVLGTFILWFGWYGFNCGSTLGFGDKATALSASKVAMNTTCSAAAGGVAVFAMRIYSTAGEQNLDLAGMCNGILAGLVAVCAGVDAVEPGMAVLIGVMGGVAYEIAHLALLKFKIDDPLDAFPVHGAGGLVGVLTRALVVTPASGPTMQGNCIGALAIMAWSGGLSAIIFGGLKAAKLLRHVDEDEYAVQNSPVDDYAAKK